MKNKINFFNDNKSLIHSYFNFFAALPFALNIRTKESAAIIKPISINKCKFTIKVIHDNYSKF